MKVKDLDLLKNIDILFENEIVLYGAGNCGRKAGQLLKKMNASLIGFCDSDVNKWGHLEGIRVLTLYEMADILKKKEHVIIIITVESPDCVEEILSLLEKHGMGEKNCYTYFALKHSVELHIDDARIEEDCRKEEKLMKKMFLEWSASAREWNTLSMIWRVLTADSSILVLQASKVGSRTVEMSLRKAGVPCFHAHTLTGRWGWTTFTRGEAGRALLSKVNKIKIISLIREPVARDIALYFQGFLEYILLEEAIMADSFEGVKRFLETEKKTGNCGAVFEWFNVELKEPLGLDIYQYEFDKMRGYQIIEKDNIELLLIKLEKLDECSEVIGRFVGKDNFSLVKSNTGNDKLSCFAYEELKRTIEIPRDILDFYYRDNPAMDHFYTAEEKEQFYRKWLGQG